MDHALKYLREKGQPVYRHAGISVVKVADEQEGIDLVLPLFQEILDRQTVLYLSGGRTPKNLYAAMTKEEQINPGAFAMVDERYGPPATLALALRAGAPIHEKSNEKMLRDVGLLRFAQMLGIPFYPILNPVISSESANWRTTRNLIKTSEKISHSVRNDKERGRVADQYDQTVRTLFAQYRRHVAILGVGLDGHTAGIPAIGSIGSQGQALQEWVEDFRNRSKNRMVIDYDDSNGFYKERITMTFQGLLMMDLLIVLVFGKDKKPALEKMFSDGSEPFGSTQGEEEVPSRFFKRPDIAKKTVVISDLEV